MQSGVGWVMANARQLTWIILPATIAGFAVVLSGCQTVSAIPKGKGVVMGGVYACWALPYKPPAQDRGFVAATVAVLRGSAKEVTQPDGVIEDVFPKQQVASQAVAHYRKYHFDLAPGTYVLVAHHPAGGPSIPWIQVVVQAGRTTSQDIPDECR